MALFWVLGGLLILTLVLASIAQRYHAYVEERRRQIERILRRVEELEAILGQLQGLPVPAEALLLLYRDILARLEVIRQVHPRQPGIADRIAKASGAQSTLGESAPLISVELSESEIDRLMRGLGQLLWMLQERRFVVPVGEDERERMMQRLALWRAEAHYRFHRRQAADLMARGQLHQALWHCGQVRQFLRDLGTDNASIRSWYQEIDERYRTISAEISGQPSESPPESPSE
ncbi:MAG: hypothetical protein P8103_05225 [Candidatus Thiodiazotropha sp.]